MLCRKCGSYNPDGSEICSVCKEPLKTGSSISIRQKIDESKLLVPIKSTVNERYFITRFIGEGTFAQVYYAIDKATNSGVALKIFKPYVFKSEEEMSRLVWGVRGIKDISHPNLSRIFDCDISAEGWVYISMKFIYGMSLKNTIKLRVEVNKPFSFEEIEPLFFQLGEILNEMHPTICHGDLKPSNVIIQPDYIKLTDSTILNYINLSNCIKEIKADKASIYLAPEILEGSEPSYRSDIYSCGRILQTLLMGSEEGELTKAQLFKYSDIVDKMLKDLIKKATNPDPLLRHSDINEFNSELFEILSIYNELPQNIKDEYHQSISAVEKKFTHIRQKVVSVNKEEEGKQRGSKKNLLIALMVVFVALITAISLYLYDRHRFFVMHTSIDSGLLDALSQDLLSMYEPDISYQDILSDEKEEDVSEIGPLDAYEKVEAGEVAEKKGAKESIKAQAIEKGKTGTLKKEEEKKEEVQKGEEEQKKEKVAKEKASGPCPPDMVYIKAGPFMMGSVPQDEGRQPDEPAFVSVNTHSYCIDRYEYPNKKGAIPRTSVTYDEADRLCSEAGKRLCTEEEWEKACKGVSMLRYPYDNLFDPLACNAESNTGEERKVSPSGKFPKCKSGYGVYDMSGNVAEWVLMKGGQKGVKGGYVNKPDWAVRCASRKVESPNKRSPYYGFRCCMDVEE